MNPPTLDHTAVQFGGQSLIWVRKRLWLFVALFFVVSIPCLWQSRIQANDLSSHLYSAWLVSQVSAGQLEGLYVVPQYTNVLFDHMLSLLLRTGSVVFTEKVAVLTCVQVFFWGWFVFVYVMIKRVPWALVPIMIAYSYGAVFRLGFMNFYLSVGLSLWAMAAFWQARTRVRFLAVPLLAVAYTAHLLPVLWAGSIVLYAAILRRLSCRRRAFAFAVSVSGIIAVIALIKWQQITAKWTPGVLIIPSLGADQISPWGGTYTLLEMLLSGVLLFCLIRRVDQAPSTMCEVPFHLWLISAAVCLAAPERIVLSTYSGGLSLITTRLSLLAGVMLVPVISSTPPGRVVRVGLGMIPFVFFSLTYVDEGRLNRLEAKVERAVHALPQGTRVLSYIHDPTMYIAALAHVVDRACIGHCYDYMHYEPATTQFRLRAEPGNPYVMTDIGDLIDFQHEKYVFDRRDISVYNVAPCDGSDSICAYPLKFKEKISKNDVSISKY